MAKLAKNVREGLRQELAGLERRLAAIEGDPDWVDQEAMLVRRIGEVNTALSGGQRPPQDDSEVRPDGNALETRPGNRAKKEEWVDHLTARGLDPAELGELTKGALIDLADTLDEQQQQE